MCQHSIYEATAHLRVVRLVMTNSSGSKTTFSKQQMRNRLHWIENGQLIISQSKNQLIIFHTTENVMKNKTMCLHVL